MMTLKKNAITLCSNTRRRLGRVVMDGVMQLVQFRR
jgi:hypothetical protein